MFKILYGDFFEKINDVEDASVDLILVDPPYLIDYKDWDTKDDDFMLRWIELSIKKLKPTGSMWIFMAKDNLFTHKFCSMGLVNILQEHGIVNLKNWITWARQKGRGASKHLKSQREEIIHFTLNENYTWNNLQVLRDVICPYVKDGRPRGWFLDEEGHRVRWTGMGNVMTYSSPQFNSISEKQNHSAQKPVMLLDRLIRLSSNERDIVFDPFMGSGSTGVACRLSNRNFIGIEINETYFNIANDRINNFDITKFSGYNLDVDKQIIEMYRTGILTKKEISKIKNNFSIDF